MNKQNYCNRCGEPVQHSGTLCGECGHLLCKDCSYELSVNEGKYCPGCHSVTPNDTEEEMHTSNL